MTISAMMERLAEIRQTEGNIQVGFLNLKGVNFVEILKIDVRD